ncbi:Major sperm protein [Meloidogyne graminicola]|uniref:Major sperm protein n=1 Tax=Meloidogyne graminicola TaxID=189291 RepID=A0A8S9ZHR1_9BILA|nr:Major sperm protein [Meloidogyne graminicola]
MTTTTPVSLQSTEVSVPGELVTFPTTKLVFNSPFDMQKVYFIKIENTSPHKIGYFFNSTTSTITFKPEKGCLFQGDSKTIDVTCDAFNDLLAHNDDRILVVWTRAPDSARRGVFHRTWFKNDGIMHIKNLRIEYNE